MIQSPWDSNSLFQAILDKCPVGIAVIDYAGEYLTINPAYCDIYGYKKNEMLHQSFTMIFPLTEKESVLERHQRFLDEGGSLAGEWTVQHRNGSMMTVVSESVTYFPIEGPPARLVYVYNITEQKKAQEQMKIVSAVFEVSQEAIMVTDENNKIISVNPAFTNLTGWSFDEIQGLSPSKFKSGRHPRFFYTDMWRTLNDTGHWKGEVWDRHKNGSEYLKELAISVIRNPDGSICNFLGMFSDITLRKKQDEIIWQQANYDAVTGLPNRHMFRTKLEQAARHAVSHNNLMALMLLDLDDFKSVNDSLGHRAGDELLGSISVRLLESAIHSDCIARLSGDEFAMIITDINEPSECNGIARNILDSLNDPFNIDGVNVFVSVSIGISLYPLNGNSLDDVFKNADRAMYAVKNDGKNNFKYYSPDMYSVSRERLNMISNLKFALKENQFVVYYQPIVSLKTGMITKAEALVRWRHPVHGLISPDIFIPLAEECGLIVQIGDWVASQAIIQLVRWRDEYNIDLNMAINFSPMQLKSNDFYSMPWLNEVKNNNVNGNAITVEITERMLLSSESRVNTTLDLMHQLGIQISIDDFGTGYSSLAYLRKFNVDVLKIDRSFINDLDGVGLDLCTAIIVMAHSLGLDVVAEGVETNEQKLKLETLKCDYIQGYLYSRPLPADEITQMILKNIDSRLE